MPNYFNNLDVHSDYSLLKGYGTVEEYVNKAKEYSQDSLALTDYGNMLGIFKFIKTCQKNDIKPIAGVTMYMAPKNEEGATYKHPVQYDSTRNYIPYGAYTTLVLLAQNMDGLKNLYKLEEISYSQDHFYYVPRIDLSILKEYSDNLICLSGDTNSSIVTRLRLKQFDEAVKEVEELKEIFGDRFYIEVMPIKGPLGYSPTSLLELAEKTNTPAVITNNVHYADKEDSIMQEKIMCIGNKNKMSEKRITEGGRRFVFSDDERYLKSQDQLVEYIKSNYDTKYLPLFSKAIKNTIQISNRIENIQLKYDVNLRPVAQLPEGYDTPYDYLKALVKEGFERKRKNCTNEVKQESLKRQEYELGIIYANDFVNYFLVVTDYCKFAKEHKYYMGPGRGSAVGSEISYLLDITEVDPIRFGLIFERFISPGRGAIFNLTYDDNSTEKLNVAEQKTVNGELKYIYQLKVGDTIDGKTLTEMDIIDPGSPPDIDSDFATSTRDKVFQYVKEKFGKENVASLITSGPFVIKNSWRSICGINEKLHGKVDTISDMLPSNNKIRLSDVMKEDSEYPTDKENILTAVGDDKFYLDYLEDVSKIQGRQKEIGVHACGIIISAEPLTETIPTHIRQEDNELITQWSMNECEQLGLIKMDFLGLKTLDIIYDTVDLVKKTRGIDIDIEALVAGSLDDEKTMELFRRGDTYGIFQFSEDGVREILRQVSPTQFTELAAITALYRPGPIGMGLHTEYAVRKNNPSARVPVDPSFIGTPLEDIIKEDFNCIIYQESIMKIAKECANFTPKDADGLRKAMGKKKKDVLAKYERQFKEGMAANGYQTEPVNKLWEGMKSFAEYAFNKCMSGNSPIKTKDGYVKLKDLYIMEDIDDVILYSYDTEKAKFIESTPWRISYSGLKPCYRVTFADGTFLEITEYHRLMLDSGRYGTIADGLLVEGASIKGHINDKKITDITPAGLKDTYDIEMDCNYPSNFVTNGIVSHNSHAVAYAVNSFTAAYLKAHYPLEFMAIRLQSEFGGKDFSSYIDEAKRIGLTVSVPDINVSDLLMSVDVEKNAVVFGMSCLKGVQSSEINNIIEERKKNGIYKNLADLIKRTSISNKTLTVLAESGTLDSFGYSRKGIVQNVEHIYKQIKKQEILNQPNSLFTLAGIQDTELVIPDIKTSNYEKCKMEASSTGTYLTNNPLNVVKFTPVNQSIIDTQKPFDQYEPNKKFENIITFMSCKIEKNRKGNKFINAIINNGHSEIHTKIYNGKADSIMLYEALSETNGDRELAYKKLNITDDVREKWDALKPIPPIKPYSAYKIKFTTYNNSIRVTDFKEIRVSDNDKEELIILTNNSTPKDLQECAKRLQEYSSRNYDKGLFSDIILCNYKNPKLSLKVEGVMVNGDLFATFKDIKPRR